MVAEMAKFYFLNKLSSIDYCIVLEHCKYEDSDNLSNHV